MRHGSYLLIALTALTLRPYAYATQPKYFNARPADVESARPPLPAVGHPLLDPGAPAPRSLAFEANAGQAGPEVKFLSRASGFVTFLTPSGALLALSGEAGAPNAAAALGWQESSRTFVRLQLIGANPALEIGGIRQLSGRSHYLVGPDRTTWRTNVPNYAAVAYRDVYPGTDLIFYGSGRQLEYDFVLAPGADPNAIVLAFDGVDRARLDENGNLVLGTAVGEIVQRAPVCYQEVQGARRPVLGRCAFRLDHRNRGTGLSGSARYDVRFDVSGYDADRGLIIDPVLAYSTYLGGSSGDAAHAVATDAAGNVYITGETSSIDFSTTPGVFQPAGSGTDVFVTKLTSSGAILYSTYLGGSNADRGNSIAADSPGNAYVTGRTGSTNFPTTPGAFRTFFGGGYDAFVAKLTPDGSALLYSTFLGAGNNDAAYGIAVDSAGSAFVAGGTNSSDFPVTANAFQPLYGGGVPGNDAFITKLMVDGAGLQYSSYLGGSFVDRANGLAIDSGGGAYLTGWTESSDFPTVAPLQAQTGGGRDAFVTKVQPDGSGIVFSTFLGGAGEDGGLAIAIDSSNSPYVTGYTESLNFPTQNAHQPASGGGRDAFVTRLDAAGTGLIFSSYLGGSSGENLVGTAEVVGAIAVDGAGRAHVTGTTRSADFPTVNPTQPAYGGGLDEAFVAKFDGTGGALTYSTFLGGNGSDLGIGIAINPSGDTYIVGETSSPDFRIVDGIQPTSGGGTDAFVTRIGETATTTADLAVTKRASPDPVMPGASITYIIELVNNGPDAATSSTLSDDLPGETTFESLTAPDGWSCTTPAAGSTGTVSCANASVAAGSTHSFALVVRVNTTLGNGAIVTNTAVAGSSTPDTNAGNNSATVTTTVSSGQVSSANLRMAITDTPDPAEASSNITYTIEVSNDGPAEAMSVNLSNNVPANTRFSSLSAPIAWSCTVPAVGETGVVSCTTGSLPAGAIEVLTLKVRVNDFVAEGTVINDTASVSSSTMDPDGGNNSAMVATTVSAADPSTADTVRFLKQSTFGPTWELAAAVQEIGFESFLLQQFGAEMSPYPRIDLRVPNPDSCNVEPDPAGCRRDYYTMYLLQAHFFSNALYGADQLRQRVAWALSQILVTSGQPYPYSFWIRPYEQLLYQSAFGNFRQLLRDVTLSPMMGRYLDMVDNRCQLRTPSDPNVCRAGRAVKPNENYARELLQLFSIGTVLMNPDGTPVLDEGENPIASYDQDTVEEFSRALTGWIFAPQVAAGVPNYIEPMRVALDGLGRQHYHDKGAKTLLNGVQLPGGQSAEAELEAVLDNLMGHQNVAPFISKQLIQKLVTSNPSPAYVARIADVFKATLSSPTQLQEVVRAILLDPEARGNVAAGPGHGHLLEPVLAMTRFLRAFKASSDGVLTSLNLGGAYQIGAAQMEQDVFRAPSVFNFYSPDFQVPGEPGVLGPEFEIYSAQTALRRANFFSRLIFLGIPAGGDRPRGTSIEFLRYMDVAIDPAMLVRQLSTLLLHDSMPPEMSEIVTKYVASIPAADPLRRVQHAVYLIVTSTHFQVER